MTNHYEILGVGRNATLEEIKKSYYDLAKKYHPDKNPGKEEWAKDEFIKIKKAYQTLSNLEDDQSEEWEEIIELSSKGIVEQKVEDTILHITEEFKSSHWKVAEEDLDFSLWNPCLNWQVKARSLRTIDELDSFRKLITSAIRNKDEEKKGNSLKEKTIERIKEEIEINGLTTKALGEDQNFEEEIKNISGKEIWQIEIIEKKVKDNIDDIIRKRNEERLRGGNSSSNNKGWVKKTIDDIGGYFLYNEQNAQKYLNEKYGYYPKNQITELDISDKNLKGWIDLSEFTSLKHLNCSKNRLNQLILPNPSNLEKLFCRGNLLTEIDFTSLDSEKLTSLDLTNNYFPEQDLSCFTIFIKLKELHLGTSDYERIQQNVYNQWKGSLKPLKNLARLEFLDISETDVSLGLEYLPKSLKKIRVGSQYKNTGCERIADQLGTKHCHPPYVYTYDLLNWRKKNPNWVETIKKINRLSKENQELEKELAERQALIEILQSDKEKLLKSFQQEQEQTIAQVEQLPK